ncbi:hypothetical protein INF30_01075 [Lachnospiraceae bacterium DSM 108991]|uniref:Uncharacterized protein n=1 Tax=Claveliimonas monacensis TaxID=2779351 RepID=A0ABR9RGV5_9FIRM|nr:MULTISPECIES: hypothetical protein [Lachnospiraceae]MBE5061862.1 hypothetical protein [Claveliimonas monacensis]
MVSFTREDKGAMEAKGYVAGKSEVGYVYYPAEGVKTSEEIAVNYIEYPWLTRFEVEGIEPS